MTLVERAFVELFPNKSFDYSAELKYSGHIKGYNASIGLNRISKNLIIKLSKQWRFIDEEIKIGLIQELLLRMFKHKARTMNIDLYNHFMRALPATVPKTRSHPVLEQSFSRVNEKYFLGLIDTPNLAVGGETVRTLGHYNFGTDTITISSLLLEHDDLLDYVMYHELLHKRQKFNSKNGRHFYHSKTFRSCEKAFENAEELERKMQRLGRNQRHKSFFGLF